MDKVCVGIVWCDVILDVVNPFKMLFDFKSSVYFEVSRVYSVGVYCSSCSTILGSRLSTL